MDTYIAAQKLPVSYTLSGNVTVVSVIGNTVTARIPMDTITSGFVKFSTTIPASSSADSPGRDNILAVDATGAYTFYSNSGWGKSPRYTSHWSDLNENVRFLKVDEPMSLSVNEIQNAWASLELRVAARDVLGLVKGAESYHAHVSVSDAISETMESILQYSSILDLVDYLPQNEGSTLSWQAGVRIATDGSMTLPYADPSTPGCVLLGGDNPFAAATVGSVYALAQWVIDYVQGRGSNLAESYIGTGGSSNATAAGSVAADWQGGTLLVDTTGRAYVPDATDQRKGLVLLSFADSGEEELGGDGQGVPLVPTQARVKELDESLKADILTTYPNKNGNPAGVVNPQGAILLQDASTNPAYSGAIDIRAAGTGMYGGVYISDNLAAQDEGSVVGPLLDYNSNEFPAVPTTAAVSAYVGDKINEVLGSYSFGDTVGSIIQQPSNYATGSVQGTLRLGDGLENVAGTGGNIVTQVKTASASVAGKVFVVNSEAENSSAPSASNIVPSVSYVKSLVEEGSGQSIPPGSVSEAGVVYVSTSAADDSVPVDSGYNRVPTVEYMKSAIEEVESNLSSETLTYAQVGADYRADTTNGGSLKQAIYEDVLNWVGTGDDGGGSGGSTMTGIDIYNALGPVYSQQSTSAGLRKSIIDDITTYAPAGGGTGAGSANIYDTLIGSDARDFRDVQAAQQYANMARRAQLNYSITLGTSPNWLGNIAWHSDVSTILDTVKSAAGNNYSLALYSAAATATYSAISQVYSGGRNRWSNVYPYSPISGSTEGRLENDLYGQVYNTILDLISVHVFGIQDASVNIWLSNGNGVLPYIRDRYVIPRPGYTIVGIDSWDSYSYINTAIYSILNRLGALESRIANIPTTDEMIAAINAEAAAAQISLTLTQKVTDSDGTVTNSGSVDETTKEVNANYAITDNGESGTYAVT